jgi:membrane protein YqaA with SNARE-associated domain
MTDKGTLGEVPTIEEQALETFSRDKAKVLPSRLKILLFVLEVCFVAALIIWWLSSESARQSKSLLVFFLYSFPAEFIIATVPHEPAILYFSKFFSPFIVTIVAIAGTILAEVINYTFFSFVADLGVFRKVLRGKAVQKTIALFRKAPFAALWVAGFTPIPFYPFRFLVVLSHYPLSLYILAVFASRTPRFFLLALAGHAFKIPDSVLVIFSLLMILLPVTPFLGRLFKKRRTQTSS